MLLGDQLYATRDERTIEKWEKYQKEWKKYNNFVSKKIGRKEDELVMNRIEKYRARIENQDLVYNAIPLEQKLAGAFWQMSLRGGGIHFVPVGNEFSGLWCPVSLDSDGSTICTVLKPKKTENSDNTRHQQYLNLRKQQLGHKISELKKFDINRLDTLIIEGEDLFPQESSSSKNTLTQNSEEIKNINNNSDGNKTLPPISLNRNTLSLNTLNNNNDSQTLQLSNNDTTPYFFNISIDKIIPPSLNSLKSHLENTDESFFICSPSSGFIQPGQSIQLFFSFSSQRPGMFSRECKIFFQPNTTPLTINLKGHCKYYDTQVTQMKLLNQQYHYLQLCHYSHQYVTDLVDRVIYHLPSLESEEAQHLFYSKNPFDPYKWLSLPPYSQPDPYHVRLYYQPSLFKQSLDLYHNIIQHFPLSKRRYSHWNYNMVSLRNDILSISDKDISTNLIKEWDIIFNGLKTRPLNDTTNEKSMLILLNQVYQKMESNNDEISSIITTQVDKEINTKKKPKKVKEKETQDTIDREAIIQQRIHDEMMVQTKKLCLKMWDDFFQIKNNKAHEDLISDFVKKHQKEEETL